MVVEVVLEEAIVIYSVPIMAVILGNHGQAPL